eukprot:XP_020400360.1 extensin-like [Zea mays]
MPGYAGTTQPKEMPAGCKGRRGPGEKARLLGHTVPCRAGEQRIMERRAMLLLPAGLSPRGPPLRAGALHPGARFLAKLFPKHRRRPPQNAVVAAAFPSCGAPPPARPGHAPAHRREPRQCSPELARPGHAPARPVHCRPTELARARRRPPIAVQSPPEHRPELAPHATDQSPRRPESDQSPPPSPHRPLRLR